MDILNTGLVFSFTFINIPQKASLSHSHTQTAELRQIKGLETQQQVHL